MYEQLQERKESSGNKTESRFIQRRSQYFLELEALGCVCVMLGCGSEEASASRVDGWMDLENMKVLQCIHFGYYKQHRDCFFNWHN